MRPYVLAFILVAGCQEEQLAELHPKIALCAAAELPAAQCDRAVDLGAVPITVPLDVTLFVRDVGGARLLVSGVETSNASITVVEHADEVFPGQAAPLSLRILLDELGPTTATLTVRSNDPDRPEHTLELLMVGVPKPAPQIEVCVRGECGVDLTVDLGLVRRTQQQGVQITVKNVGTAPLAIEAVRLDGDPSVPGELVIATSTRPAELAVDDAAPVVVVYQPADGGDDVTLVIESNDENVPQARVRILGRSTDNDPPIAVALDGLTRGTDIEVVVGDVVQGDGTASSDPEGDPLVYEWRLVAPSMSTTTLVDAAAARASFVPDAAGLYRLSLVVRDSLGQASSPAEILVRARPRFGFRAELQWSVGGDVDLHVVERGASLFSSRDCHFEAPRRVDFGVGGAPEDDCLLLDDALGAPGFERAVIEQPASGTYEIWAHVFDDGGLGPIDVEARIIIDDAAAPALLQTRTLPGSCATWHVADITFPGATINIVGGSIGSECR
jgi:hypothetical protein